MSRGARVLWAMCFAAMAPTGCQAASGTDTSLGGGDVGDGAFEATIKPDADVDGDAAAEGGPDGSEQVDGDAGTGGEADGTAAGACEDGVDNDGDGWIDGADPDCPKGEAGGFGKTPCNDGKDNDGDGLIDAADPECNSAFGDETLGTGGCVDVCVLDDVDSTARRCELYRPATGSWNALQDGSGFLENRARSATMWLRHKMEPAGGIMSGFYADAALGDVVAYGNKRDSAIWTGTYLAAEALRYLSDGHPEALDHVEQSVRVLHRWFNISGDPAYLARFVAPAGSAAPIEQIFDPADSENHLNVPYEGETWHSKGSTSRDQYQGPLLGYALAYEATSDETTRELIREDVVELVEQLMKLQPHDVKIVISGLTPTPVTINSITLNFQYTIFAPSDSSLGAPEILVDSQNLGTAEMRGFQEFYPDMKALLAQVPALSWIPSVPRSSSAIMLASYFLVALEVTDGVPAWASRRAAIKSFYEGNASSWLDMAKTWSYGNQCGSKYYGVHIAFEPMYNLARLEYDPVRRQRIRGEVLKSHMWDGGVAGHKNVFFGYVYGANPPDGVDVSNVVALHSDQLRQFRIAPLVIQSADLSAQFPADPQCPGLTTAAIDVGIRPLVDYMWQQHPWQLQQSAEPNHTLPGVDYLVAYWMGRYHGFIPKDDVVECLRWH